MRRIYFVAAGIVIAAVIGIVFVVAQNPMRLLSGGSDKVIAEAMGTLKCPKVEKPVPYADSYLGPLIDTHIHIGHIPEGPVFESLDADDNPVMGKNITIADYVCMMDTEGTKSVFGFFPVWDPIIPESIKLVSETLKQYPDRFLPFIMPPDHDDRADGFPTVTAEVLENMLAMEPGMFRGYGEIGLYARGDHGGPKGSPALFPDSARMKAIYPVVRKHKLLVYVHLGEGQQESFERALSANPDISFIWHGDQLIPYKNGKQDLAHIEEILSRHPNAYYGVDELYGDRWIIKPGVSKETFFAHFQNYEFLLAQDMETWKGFIERHPDQVLWGTDRGWSTAWSVDQRVALKLNHYSRAFIGRLDPIVQEKFAHKNAERLMQER